MDGPTYGTWDPNVCQACGWGALKPRDKSGRVELPHLILYWCGAVVLLGGTGLPLLLSAGLPFFSRIEALSIFIFLWTLYACIGGLVEVKVNLDWLGMPLGFLLDLHSSSLLVLAALLFPGRIVYMAFAQSLRYSKQDQPEDKKKRSDYKQR
ncbi:hypothetical protein JXA32_04555 [Candidatus Sumerlaeota bacterium]|nr:hypothetical protein [Candidatus Sumerlaeota bacterium]